MSDTKPQLLCWSLASPLEHRCKGKLSLFHTVKPTCSMRTCTAATYCVQLYTAATSPVSTCIISKITRALRTLIPKGGLQGCHFQEPSVQVQSFTSLALWEISLMWISPLTLRSLKAQWSPILTQCSPPWAFRKHAFKFCKGADGKGQTCILQTDTNPLTR